jgi:hypothetical protein
MRQASKQAANIRRFKEYLLQTKAGRTKGRKKDIITSILSIFITRSIINFEKERTTGKQMITFQEGAICQCDGCTCTHTEPFKRYKNKNFFLSC